MRKRRRQHETAGCYCDADGYKQSPKGLRPTSPQGAMADRLRDYPYESEVDIMNRAIRQRWPITEEIKQAVVDHMVEIIRGDPENAEGAARVLIAAEKQNQDDKLKRRKRDKISVNTILQLSEPTAPDPEYVQWKRLRLIEQSRLQIEYRNDNGELSGDR